MKKLNNKAAVWRSALYLFGLVVLALGIVLNTKTNLGVSPIISVPFSIASVLTADLGNVIFLFYAFCIFLEWALDRKGFAVPDLLQIIMSLVTSRFINLFDALLPACPDSYPVRFLVLAAAIILTGIGAALTVMMKIVPNPADALAGVIGRKTGKNLGFGKNLFDLTALAVSITIGLVFSGGLIGIGVGTVLSVIFTGRAIAAVNKWFGSRLLELAGLDREAEPTAASSCRTEAEPLLQPIGTKGRRADDSNSSSNSNSNFNINSEFGPEPDFNLEPEAACCGDCTYLEEDNC